MKIQELRIGNWFIGYNGKPFQWSLGHFGLLTLKKNRPEIDDIIKLPIPLTEEILLKCGLTQKGSLFGIGFLDTIYWYNRENQILYIEYTDSPFVEDEGMRYPVSSPIKHLHVLMNIIYDLTGEELEVKL